MSKALAKLVDSNKLVEFQKMDEFLELVNLDPPKSWLEDHPTARGVKYMSIERVEWLLTKIFQEWRPEVIDASTMFNSITCTVRLHYRHPLTGWTYSDGVAAVPAKTDKGAKASDMSSIKSDSVMTGLPAAKSFAIKDAADHIGKIFGRDINRRGQLDFDASYKSEVTNEEKIKNAKTKEELKEVLSKLDADEKKATIETATKRAEEINAKSN